MSRRGMVALIGALVLESGFLAQPVLGAALVQGGKPACAGQWIVQPSPNPGQISDSLSAVAAVSADDVWAVGERTLRGTIGGTLVEHWDGTSWNVVKTPPWRSDPRAGVEVRGFEPLTSAVRRQRSTGLSYTPRWSSVTEAPRCF